MALGFIKKVFSFGRQEVEERPAETEALAPLNFDALKDLTDTPTPIPQPTPTEPPSPAETPPARPLEEPAPARPQPEIVPEPGPPETEPTPPEVPKPQPAQPAELPTPTPVEIPAPAEPFEPQPSIPEHVPDAPGPTPAPTPVEIPAPGPNLPSEPSAGQAAVHPLSSPPAASKVTVAKKVEQKAAPAKAPTEPAPRPSWFQRLREGLSRSSKELSSNIAGVFTRRKLDEDTLQDLEDVLIRADLGMETAIRVTDALSSGRYGRDVSDAEVRAIMAEEVEKVLTPVALPLELDLAHKPHVVLVVGVNGTGKTTTIGKLAAKLTAGGLKVMLAAGDTFRAAAIEQLKSGASAPARLSSLRNSALMRPASPTKPSKRPGRKVPTC